MLITFSGLDGSGKSSLVEWLRAELEAKHQPVAVLHMNKHFGLYAILRAIRDTLVRGGPQAGGGSGVSKPFVEQGASGANGWRGARYALVWNKSLRRWIYLLDLCVFLGYRALVEKAGGRVLIMDRYFYDTLVDVSDGRRWFWLRLLQKITPTPTVPVFIDVGPEQSFGRKGEYSIEYLRRRYTAYREIFGWVPSAARLVNHDLESTRAALWQTVTERRNPHGPFST